MLVQYWIAYVPLVFSQDTFAFFRNKKQICSQAILLPYFSALMVFASPPPSSFFFSFLHPL